MALWKTVILIIIVSSLPFSVWADAKSVRWTDAQDVNAELGHVIGVINSKTSYDLLPENFQLLEELDLATCRYKMYSQTSDGIPIHGRSIRIWTDRSSAQNIQTEATVENPLTADKWRMKLKLKGLIGLEVISNFSPEETARILKRTINWSSNDNRIRDLQWLNEWKNNELVRTIVVKGQHGQHTITLSLTDHKILSQEYQEYPHADRVNADDEFSVPVQVFPIWEETEDGKLQRRAPRELKHLKRRVARVEGDIYASLKTRRYLDFQNDPLFGATAAGKKRGYWSIPDLKRQAARVRENLPKVANDFSTGRVILDGRYATVNFYPSAAKLKGLDFVPSPSAQLGFEWKPHDSDEEIIELIPMTTLLGRPLTSPQDAWTRRAARLPVHDAISYANDGFDEIQVYYAIDTLMESLGAMGFSDPELSTRPFNAFLYDPGISMQDNAYYTGDTINFTTYTPKHPNLARDNSIIWHELGHGVMDRLMGDSMRLADTGGLSEGMADFVAALVIARITNGKPFEGSDGFRILNNTGFYLTNEAHDDGEAYGGAMKDLLDAAMTRRGREGLLKVADVILEAMRLTRNHPGLTASGWFNHVLFADARGHAGIRAPGELRELIRQALAGRNYNMDGSAPASFTLKNGQDDVTGSGPGSRRNPISVFLTADQTATFHLDVSLKSSARYRFEYPVQVRVQLKGGPLQGALRWHGKETEPLIFTLKSENDHVSIPLTISGTCENVNRSDGSCVDYAYIQIWNKSSTAKPVAKKRFYLSLEKT